MSFKTADLSDLYPDLQHCMPGLISYGGHSSIQGSVHTVKCFEDNSLVRELLSQPGDGAVLVVDAGGSMRCAMLGDILAAKARDNNWAGVIMNGLIRDSVDIAAMPVGVWALGTYPKKSRKQGVGDVDIVVHFHGVTFTPGDYLYADADGIVVSSSKLL